MTALIKTIIAAVIGLFGSLEMDQTTAGGMTRHLEQKTYNHCDVYVPSEDSEYCVNSWDWLNLSSPS